MRLSKLLNIFKKKPRPKISYPRPIRVNNPVYPRRVWTGPDTYEGEGVDGINVVYGGKIWSFGQEGFYDIVDRCLSDIYWNPAGRYLINTIIEKTSGRKRVEIVPGSSNLCRGASTAGSLPLLLSLDSEKGYNKIEEMEKALRNMGFFNRRGFIWLANNISKIPEYSFKGYKMAPVRITTDDVQQWFESEDPNHHIYKCLGPNVNKALRESLRLRIIISLYDGAPSNRGGGSSLNFDPNYMGGANNHRPPAIGLAHELIHSYYFICGRQIGTDFGKYSTMLFEYLCVGIGPWWNKSPRNGRNNIHENNIREEWIPNVFGGWENAFVPGPRAQY